jgi:hypothetical protein
MTLTKSSRPRQTK